MKRWRLRRLLLVAPLLAAFIAPIASADTPNETVVGQASLAFPGFPGIWGPCNQLPLCLVPPVCCAYVNSVAIAATTDGTTGSGVLHIGRGRSGYSLTSTADAAYQAITGARRVELTCVHIGERDDGRRELRARGHSGIFAVVVEGSMGIDMAYVWAGFGPAPDCAPMLPEHGVWSAPGKFVFATP